MVAKVKGGWSAAWGGAAADRREREWQRAGATTPIRRVLAHSATGETLDASGGCWYGVESQRY